MIEIPLSPLLLILLGMAVDYTAASISEEFVTDPWTGINLAKVFTTLFYTSSILKAIEWMMR